MKIIYLFSGGGCSCGTEDSKKKIERIDLEDTWPSEWEDFTCFW